MNKAFQCSFCGHFYPHPDLADECESKHYDARGVCPSCDSSTCNFDLLEVNGERKYVCRHCRLVVNHVAGFNDLYNDYLWEKQYYKSCGSYYARDLREHAWVTTTGWNKSRNKHKFYDGPLKGQTNTDGGSDE